MRLERPIDLIDLANPLDPMRWVSLSIMTVIGWLVCTIMDKAIESISCVATFGGLAEVGTWLHSPMAILGSCGEVSQVSHWAHEAETDCKSVETPPESTHTSNPCQTYRTVGIQSWSCSVWLSVLGNQRYTATYLLTVLENERPNSNKLRPKTLKYNPCFTIIYHALTIHPLLLNQHWEPSSSK